MKVTAVFAIILFFGATRIFDDLNAPAAAILFLICVTLVGAVTAGITHLRKKKNETPQVQDTGCIDSSDRTG